MVGGWLIDGWMDRWVVNRWMDGWMVNRWMVDEWVGGE